MNATFRTIQGCGENFFRVYNEAGRVVMTARPDETGGGQAIWTDPAWNYTIQEYKDAIASVFRAAKSPFLRSYDSEADADKR